MVATIRSFFILLFYLYFNMKNIFSIAAIMLFAIASSFAQATKSTATPVQTQPAPVKAANPKAAVMKFETEIIDYGTILQGSERVRKFHFVNTGKEPLVIQRAQGSCGCTIPTFPKEPVMPGQKGVVEVNYDTNRLGAFTKTVTIYSNASEETKVLTIKGNVEAQPEGIPAKNGGLLAPAGH